MNSQTLRRELARTIVPSVLPGAPSRRRLPEPPMDAAACRAVEAQRLSRELAHLYRRDVAVDGRLAPGQFARLAPDGAVFRGMQDPPRGFIERAAYRQLSVAPDVARRVLERDSPEETH